MLTIMDEQRVLLVVVDDFLDVLKCEGAHAVVTVCCRVNVEVPETIERRREILYQYLLLSTYISYLKKLEA